MIYNNILLVLYSTVNGNTFNRLLREVKQSRVGKILKNEWISVDRNLISIQFILLAT